MTFQQFENARRKNLKAEAKDRFDLANHPQTEPTFRVSLLLESQFYMQELDRRHDGWIATRDLILEIVVILLIGGEIWLGHTASNDQGELMKRQTTVLQKLDTSTASTARTLTALQATTETMNRAIQRQLGILSEVSVDITFDLGQKRIDILNRGNVNIELWGTKLDQQQPTMENEPRIISRGGFYYILAETFYKEVSEKFPKGTDRIVPFEIYLKDDAGTEYLGKVRFLIKWNGDTPDIHSQLTSLERKRWSGIRASR